MSEEKKCNWTTLFQQNSGGISSKRVLSVIIILSCVGVFIASFITEKPIPEFGEMLLFCAVSLYGVEKIPSWNKTTPVS